MTVVPARKKGRKKGRMKVSLGMNWNVLRGIPLSHFPLILPGVSPLLAPLIMFRLKRRGLSYCRVEASRHGLTVFAER